MFAGAAAPLPFGSRVVFVLYFYRVHAVRQMACFLQSSCKSISERQKMHSGVAGHQLTFRTTMPAQLDALLCGMSAEQSDLLIFFDIGWRSEVSCFTRYKQPHVVELFLSVSQTHTHTHTHKCLSFPGGHHYRSALSLCSLLEAH